MVEIRLKPPPAKEDAVFTGYSHLNCDRPAMQSGERELFGVDIDTVSECHKFIHGERLLGVPLRTGGWKVIT